MPARHPQTHIEAPALPLPGMGTVLSHDMPPFLRQLADLRAEADRRAPGSLMVSVVGDFIEAFSEPDAPRLASLLDIQLTTKDLGRGFVVPWAGFPIRAAGTFLPRLLQAGVHVVLVEQLEPSSEAKNRLVRRGITRVLTPGTLPAEYLTDAEAKGNYLAAISAVDDAIGLAYVDVTTGRVALTQATGDSAAAKIAAELVRLTPSECLLRDGDAVSTAITADLHVTARDDLASHVASCERAIRRQYRDLPDAANIQAHAAANHALGLLIGYLHQSQAAALPTLLAPSFYPIDGHMLVDRQTRRNLGLTESESSVGASLLSTMNRTVTAMGGRALRDALGAPLLDPDRINRRLDAVDALISRSLVRSRVREALKGMGDLERLAVRAGQQTLSPRDCLAMAAGFERVANLRQILGGVEWPAVLSKAVESLTAEPDLVSRIRATIEPEASATFGAGTIRKGVSAALDEQRSLGGDARQWIAKIEGREREATGIRQVKVAYSKAIGYYLAVPVSALNRQTDLNQRAQTDAATLGAHLEALGWRRKQTLAGEERFITDELRDLDVRVARAGDEAFRLERQAFDDLLVELSSHAMTLAQTATAVGQIDLLASLAQIAQDKSWTRPTVDADDRIEIVGGRHPVAEDLLPAGSFVPNDTSLDTDQRIMLLTGPNMAGKSTYLRQIGIIVLMAHCGSYVPAAEARIGCVDRIFTRLGADDSLATGRSTFLVEMEEAATILAAATARSLVLIDELGRSTGTRDGIAVATAVLTALLHRPTGAPRGVVATHYHELGGMTEREPRLKPWRMDVLEREHDVVFLHQVVEGAADRSYGVHVAKLAGLPMDVTDYAARLLVQMEAEAELHRTCSNGHGHHRAEPEASVARAREREATKPLRDLAEHLAAIDVLNISPLAAQQALFEARERARAALVDTDTPGAS